MKQIGKLFMEETKFQKLGASNQVKGYRQPPLEMEFDHDAGIIDLPRPDYFKCGGDAGFNSVISKRCSRRSYSDEPLTAEELSYLLWCTQGVKNVVGDTVTYRNVPSAGARHAFETYILATGLPGLIPVFTGLPQLRINWWSSTFQWELPKRSPPDASGRNLF